MKPKNTGTKLKQSIFTHMVIVPFIPFFLVLGVSFYYFTTALERNTTSSLKRIVTDHRNMIESFLSERKADLEFLARTHTYEEINSEQGIHFIFENLKKRSGAFIDLGLFDASGFHVRYSGEYELQGKRYAEEFWFKQVMQDGTFISDVFLGYRNVPHFVIAVKQGTGDNAWILRATIDTLFFERLISRLKIGNTGESYILNDSGIFQSERWSSVVRILEPDPEFPRFPVSDAVIQTFIQADASGNEYLYATTWLKNKNWLLVVRQEKKEVYQFLYTSAYINLIIVVVGGAVIILAATFITGRILRQIEKLGREKKSLGNQLIRAVQLAEIGEMATGFAHEINNPLQIIKSEHALIQTLLKDISMEVKPEKRDDMDEIEDSLDQILLQVNRCSDITQSILKFGRKNETRKALLNPSQVIPEIVHMIEKKAEVNGIGINRRVSEDAPAFMADPSQFQQVLINLFNNAMDAIIERHGSSGGVLGVEARKEADGFLAICISDNGSGIKQENIQKIFSPFFTTKPVGKGTGLGLSVCFGIIQNFGGTMEVQSEENVGTTFKIRLPAEG